MSAAEMKAKWPWNLQAGAERHNTLARLEDHARHSNSKRDVAHSVWYDALRPLDLFCHASVSPKYHFFFFF